MVAELGVDGTVDVGPFAEVDMDVGADVGAGAGFGVGAGVTVGLGACVGGESWVWAGAWHDTVGLLLSSGFAKVVVVC